AAGSSRIRRRRGERIDEVHMLRRLGSFIRRHYITLIVCLLAANLVRIELHKRAQSTPPTAEVPVILPPLAFAPYTVTLQERVTTAGRQSLGARIVTALRADGASAELFEYLQANKQNKRVVQRTIRFPDGRRVDVN